MIANNCTQRTPRFRSVCILRQWRGAAGAERWALPQMWAPLQHPSHVECYEEYQQHRKSPDQDWMPMVRAVQHLQSLPVASRLYAFTSLWRFHITTSPTYRECDKHASVEIVWHWPERRFHIAFGRLAEGWLDDRPAEQMCEEPGFAAAVEPFIQRLLAPSPSATGTGDG